MGVRPCTVIYANAVATTGDLWCGVPIKCVWSSAVGAWITHKDPGFTVERLGRYRTHKLLGVTWNVFSSTKEKEVALWMAGVVDVMRAKHPERFVRKPTAAQTRSKKQGR